jgi:hypothetical protein
MKRFISIIATALVALTAVSCFGIDEGNYKELAPITFNEVSSVIDVDLGQELVYDKLQVTSDKPVEYQWAYGPKKTLAAKDEYEMESMEVISTDPAIRYTFKKLGQFVLRLRVDNGESIEYKNFTLNVNSGLDEGLCILNTNAEGKSALTFIKKRTEDEVAANEQEIWPDVFKTINPDQAITDATDIFMSFHEKDGVFAQILISTNDERGTIYKLEPKTFVLMAMNRMQEVVGTYCAGFTGHNASGATYNYTLMRGANGHTYRYDLFGDFIGERFDATAAGLVTGQYTMIYSTNNKYSSTNQKSMLFNETTVYQPGNGKVTAQTLSGYKIVNIASDRDANKTYVLMQSEADPTAYTIKYTTGSLGAYKAVKDFTAATLNMDKNSIMVNAKNSADVYYNYNNKVWRWGLTAAPSESPVSTITIPAGETITAMGTNFMGDFPDGTDESLLYVATYNESTGKGSLYVYDILTETLVSTYADVCEGKPVKLLYKYRIG